MDWQAIWTWLADSDNRAILTFLGGGLAALIAGSWAVIKYIHKSREKERPSVTVTADRGSIAGGRDVYVERSDSETQRD